jgi:hypothetical protein
MKSVDGYDSFITFTDDYSHYDYIYPIKERTKALDKLKIFKVKVENQHNLNIKIVRSDRGGEYYGQHTPYGRLDIEPTVVFSSFFRNWYNLIHYYFLHCLRPNFTMSLTSRA